MNSLDLLKQRVPNWLTYSRIAVIPFFIGAFYLADPLAHLLASSIFLYASLTDFLDGYLARTWQASTTFGRVLDPIADKLLVAVALLMLVHTDRTDMLALPAAAILCREILVSGLREFLIELRVSIPVTRLAKYKTALQMLALYLLLLGPLVRYADIVGTVMLWAAAVLTLVTGYLYLRIGLDHMRR